MGARADADLTARQQRAGVHEFPDRLAGDGGVIPASSSTRSRSSSLADSIIRTGTRRLGPSSRPWPARTQRPRRHGTKHSAGSPSATT
jgi:hypothetical protein